MCSVLVFQSIKACHLGTVVGVYLPVRRYPEFYLPPLEVVVREMDCRNTTRTWDNILFRGYSSTTVFRRCSLVSLFIAFLVELKTGVGCLCSSILLSKNHLEIRNVRITMSTSLPVSCSLFSLPPLSAVHRNNYPRHSYYPYHAG